MFNNKDSEVSQDMYTGMLQRQNLQQDPYYTEMKNMLWIGELK